MNIIQFQGLRNYLQDFQFSNAKQDDLWNHLTLQAHRDKSLPNDLDVKTIMDTWTLQKGYPVIYVRRNYENNTATVIQERFLADKKTKNSTQSQKYSWWIPLTYASVEDSFADVYPKNWMKEGEETKVIEDMPGNDVAIVFNVQQTGYYRYLSLIHI